MWEKGRIIYALHRSIQGTYHAHSVWRRVLKLRIPKKWIIFGIVSPVAGMAYYSVDKIGGLRIGLRKLKKETVAFYFLNCYTIPDDRK